MKQLLVILSGLGIICFASAPALAQVPVGPTMCACPGQHKPLGNNATCEDACYGSRSSSGGSSGGGGGYTTQEQLLLDGAGALGRAMGEELHKSLFGDPAADARKAQAAAQAAEQQRQAAEQRRAEEQRQLELSRQRIFGLLKGAESSTGLALKTDDSDAPLMVTETRGMFGSPELVPINRGDSSPAVSGLQLKLGDDAEISSKQAGQGFDTKGKMLGGDLPPPPPTPSASPVEKEKILNALKSKLKKNEAEEQSLKDKLAQLKKATTPDPVAIKQVQEKIVGKEKEKEKIKRDLTAEDPDAQGTDQPTSKSGATSAGATTKGATH